MKTSFYRFAALLLFAAALTAGCGERTDDMRLLYWNIQNGMWSDQSNGYDNFVAWVKGYDPDVCVWCEAQSIYKSGTAERMDSVDRYLTANWGELAARYGHKYWYVGGHRDNFPQVVTGNTVNSYNLTYFLFRITEASHDHLKPLGSPCANLQIISFTYFTADRFIHLSAAQRYFPADNDLSSGDDRYFCTLCTDIYDHISFRIFQIDTHGNGICNGCLYHKYAIFL